jgi:hypothetical protein
MGDMNSRTGERDDFIHCDQINHIIPNAPSVLNYENETRLCHRKNTDKFINNFGRKLLELCKATGLRIVNGRHVDDSVGNATFFCSRGNSLIDYVLAESNDFDSNTEFSSGKFNIFSDHSPICFELSNVLILSLNREHVQVQGTCR